MKYDPQYARNQGALALYLVFGAACHQLVGLVGYRRMGPAVLGLRHLP